MNAPKPPPPPDSASAGGSGALTPDELIRRLRTALSKDGDFPASAKIVTELRQLTSDPKTTANQITEVILREPSLGTRVLHLVNSSFYRRAKPIMTVSQAVIQIGMRPLAELCAGLVLLQKFVPTARQGGSFANCLRKTLLSSLLSSSLASSASSSNRGAKNDEFGYLAGSFAELGTLLLAFYFPQIYEAAIKRAETKKQTIAKSILEITGLSPYQLSQEVLDALQLPAFYKDVLGAVDEKSRGKTTPAAVPPNPTAASIDALARAVTASSAISAALVSGKSRQDLDVVLQEVKGLLGVDLKTLGNVISELPSVFKDHCASIDLQLPALPEFVSTYAKDSNAETGVASPKAAASEEENQFNQFVSEIRQAVESREPTSSIITSVMETLTFALHFNRVVLLLMTAGKKTLTGRLGLGDTSSFDPRQIIRPLGSEASPRSAEVKAVKESRPVFIGEPVLEGGWPLAAIPIGFGQRTIGVIYADRDLSKATGPGGKELTSQEQAAIGILAELLDRSISLHS